MANLSSFGWKRDAAVGLALAVSLLVAGRGRAQEPPVKIDFPGKAADKKADDKTKPDDASKDEPKAGAPSGGSPQTGAINQHFVKFWADNNTRPSNKATHHEFVRRVYLDILGRIPSSWEVQNYVNDPNYATKRSRLIHKLLHDEHYKTEFEDHWADVWTTLLLTRGGNSTYTEQMHLWLEEQFGKNRPWDQVVRDLLTASGETNDNGAVNYILAHIGEPQRDRGDAGQFDAVPITSRTTRLFLGQQIQCAQCHHHPFNPEWKQHHFWGVNAFFRQVERVGTPLMRNNQMNMAAKLTLKDNSSYNSRGKVEFEDRQAVVFETASRFLDGKRLPDKSNASRRDALAQFVTENEMFPKAFVNRMWGHFFGRGLNQNPTVDDFGEHNQVVHAELLDGLAKAFKDYKFNVKELISWVCNSEPYNLSCQANTTNNKPEHEVYFSRMLLKNMTPEQLYESLKTAMDQPEKPVAKTPTRNSKKPPADKAAIADRKRKREAWLAKLTRNFGDDEGNEITFNGTVVQALLMMNGRELQEELTRRENNTVANAMRKGSASAILNELTMAALSRPATPKEMAVVINEGKLPYGTAQAFWEDVFWTLLNSNEFVLNH